MSEYTKKPEKIASAIYLVTSFFDDKEPLKWRLRNLSADLVSEGVKDKFSTIREILSLFSVAKTAGLISEMNHSILIRELSGLENDLGKPLNLMFPRDIVLNDKVIPQPLHVEYLKDNSVDKRLADKPVLKEFGAVLVKKNSRQSVIIAILKRKREIMIKDVTPLISGCSEKTIQRELLEMVHSGVLKKVGEKRWSRYSLAQ